MPDICMCGATKNMIVCPKASTCHRRTATPSKDRQSWFMVAPFDLETGECEHYWPNALDDAGMKLSVPIPINLAPISPELARAERKRLSRTPRTEDDE